MCGCEDPGWFCSSWLFGCYLHARLCMNGSIVASEIDFVQWLGLYEVSQELELGRDALGLII